ncbi:MAG: tyrosine-type recombinase/integrase, partial [Lachnospiraceae bacterium]
YYKLRSTVLNESARSHELCYLKRFDKYLLDNGVGKGGLSETVLVNWISMIQGKSSTIESVIIVIRQFLKYLQISEGEYTYIPIIPKVRDEYVPYLFSEDEMKMIFSTVDACELQKDSKADPNLVIVMPIILRLLYGCGLRIGETIMMKVNDVDFECGILYMKNTKGDKHRLVPMSHMMSELLQKYCFAMRIYDNQESWLFPSAINMNHVSDRAVKNRFKKILDDNNICLHNRQKYERGPCLHCLRHVFTFKSFAQAERLGKHLDDAIPYLSIYLGHEGLNETSKYLKFSNEMFPESIDAFGSYMDEVFLEVSYEV